MDVEIEPENWHLIVFYGEELAMFYRACPTCGRFVKADSMALINDRTAPNATCSKCGRVIMPFQGYGDR